MKSTQPCFRSVSRVLAARAEKVARPSTFWECFCDILRLSNRTEDEPLRNNLTELVFILDRSGSMAGLQNDTIGGYNAMLDRQRSEPGRALVSTVLFDDRYELLHVGNFLGVIL